MTTATRSAHVCVMEPRNLLSVTIFAAADELAVWHDQSGTVDVLANDSAMNDDIMDPTPVTLTASLVSGPQYGSVTDLGGGLFEYTPAPMWAGTDFFTYAASAGGSSQESTVSITVDRNFIFAMSDQYAVHHDQPLPGGVLDNDTQTDVPLRVTDYTQPQHGSVSMNTTTGVFTYTPEAGYVGPDLFEYTITDDISIGAGGPDESTTTVAIDVTNMIPVPVGDSYEIGQGGILHGGSVLVNDFSPDIDVETIVDYTLPLNGTLDFNTSTGNFVYRPAPSFVGFDTFQYTLSDGVAETAAGVSIQVDGFDLEVSVEPSFDNPYPVAEVDAASDGVTATFVQLQTFRLYSLLPTNAGAGSYALVFEPSSSMTLWADPFRSVPIPLGVPIPVSSSVDMLVYADPGAGGSANLSAFVQNQDGAELRRDQAQKAFNQYERRIIDFLAENGIDGAKSALKNAAQGQVEDLALPPITGAVQDYIDSLNPSDPDYQVNVDAAQQALQSFEQALEQQADAWVELAADQISLTARLRAPQENPLGDLFTSHNGTALSFAPSIQFANVLNDPDFVSALDSTRANGDVSALSAFFSEPTNVIKSASMGAEYDMGNDRKIDFSFGVSGITKGGAPENFDYTNQIRFHGAGWTFGAWHLEFLNLFIKYRPINPLTGEPETDAGANASLTW